jgi:hypothetical protein
MTAGPFRYSDAQWRKLEGIVARAGRADAWQKFNAQRPDFERMVGGWKVRIANWNGYTWGTADTSKYKRVEQAAGELKAALADLTFPPVFAGNDVLWKRLDGTEENWEAETKENPRRFDAFNEALDHIRLRAALMASPRQKQARYARDRFFGDLGRVWRVELGLPIKASGTSRFVSFVEAASEGVCSLSVTATRNMISSVVRKWPRR